MNSESSHILFRTENQTNRSYVDLARQVAAVLREDAANIDTESTFPVRGLKALRQSGLMSLLVPSDIGGAGVSYVTLSKVAQILSSECLSTGLIWAMHCQQVAVIEGHAPAPLRLQVLKRVLREGCYIASVTSEHGRRARLQTALTPLVLAEDNSLILSREAPTITGGLHADGYLVTMRAHESASQSEVVFVYVDRDDVEVIKTNSWNALGMRGTDSVGLCLKGRLSKDNIINKPALFKNILVNTMIPVGHIAWASCWLGCASGIFRRVIASLRNPQTRRSYNLKSDLFTARLARMRLEIDLVDSYLSRVIRDYENLIGRGSNAYHLSPSTEFLIRINGLKVLASERLFDVMNGLIECMGMEMGYTKHDNLPLERAFRDLRSASLMISNDRLLIENGKLCLFEFTPGDGTS